MVTKKYGCLLGMINLFPKSKEDMIVLGNEGDLVRVKDLKKIAILELTGMFDDKHIPNAKDFIIDFFDISKKDLKEVGLERW